MSPRPDASRERIPQILDAAINVFARLGFSHARMEDLAEEAGVSKGTLYLYFDSKDALIQAIMENLLVRELDHARSLAQGQGSAADKLRGFARVMGEDFRRLGPFIGLYFEFMALITRRKSGKALIQRYFEEFLSILEPLIREGIDSGEFRQVDVRETALAIGALLEGVILLWAYSPDAVDLETQFEAGVLLLLDGLRARGE